VTANGLIRYAIDGIGMLLPKYLLSEMEGNKAVIEFPWRLARMQREANTGGQATGLEDPEG
jgi:hypothetical protein